MMIYPAEYIKNMYTAGYIIILEIGVNSSLEVVGGRASSGRSFNQQESLLLLFLLLLLYYCQA